MHDDRDRWRRLVFWVRPFVVVVVVVVVVVAVDVVVVDVVENV